MTKQNIARKFIFQVQELSRNGVLSMSSLDIEVGVSFEFELPNSSQTYYFLCLVEIQYDSSIKIHRFSEATMNCWQPFLKIRSSAFDLFCRALRLYTTWQVFDCSTYADSTMLMGTFPIFVTFILHHGIQEERLIVMINMKEGLVLFARDPFDYVINLDLLWQKSSCLGNT